MARAKKQTRRSISVKGDIYDRVKKYCEEHNISMSAFVEERILEYLEHIEKGTPLPHLMGGGVPLQDKKSTSKKEQKAEPRMSQEEIEKEVSQHFTF